MKKTQLMLASVALTLLAGSPAIAGVTIEEASLMQGILVHGTGVLQEQPEVIANLGAGGPNIVHFIGDTDETAATSGEDVRLQQGQGQADITGAEISPGGPANDADLYNLISGDIFLTGNEGMSWIEFGLTGLTSGSVDFLISLSSGGTQAFNAILGSGDTHFGFLANGGDLITNVHYAAGVPPTELTILKQVRILREGDPNIVPEPSTWAMMLLGFGAIGFSMRSRRRRQTALQIA